MSFFHKPPSFAHCSHNLASTPVQAYGTSVTAGANNADGTVAQVTFNTGTTLTHDVEYLVIAAQGFSSSASNGKTLLDILIDPAGGTSWSSLIDDLCVGFTIACTNAQPTFPTTYHFPFWIPAGASIALRARTAHTSDITGGTVAIVAQGGNRNPKSWWCGQKIESIGIDASNSKGVNHLPGNSGSYSTWANFGSTLSAWTGAVQWAVHGTDAAALALFYNLEFGVASTRIGPPIFKVITAGESGGSGPHMPLFCSLPSGTQLMVRGTCSASAETLDVAAYAVQ